MFGPSKLLRDPTFDGQIPNPVAVVQHYWPSRAHAPSYAYTRASNRYRRRPLAVGDIDLPLYPEVPPVPCTGQPGDPCPTGGGCCGLSREYYPETGFPTNICASEIDCWDAQNQMERAICSLHPEMKLTCEPHQMGEWCYCERDFSKTEGQIPIDGQPLTPPPTTESPNLGAPTPAPTTAMTNNEKLITVGAVALSALGLLYLARR